MAYVPEYSVYDIRISLYIIFTFENHRSIDYIRDDAFFSGSTSSGLIVIKYVFGRLSTLDFLFDPILQASIFDELEYVSVRNFFVENYGSHYWSDSECNQCFRDKDERLGIIR